MQLAAAGGPVGEQALEELYRGRHHDRRIPVLGRAAQLAGAAALVVAAAPRTPHVLPRRLPVVAGVVFEHVLVVSQRFAEHLRGLLDDGGERDDDDNAAQP